MPVLSKFSGVQKSRFGNAESHTEEVMIFGAFIALIATLFGVNALSRKKFTVSEDVLFSQQMRQIEKKNGKPQMEDFPQNISMYEISFLKKMIAGNFNNYSAESFQSKMDRNLFMKFNALSQPELETTYQNYKKLLKATA